MADLIDVLDESGLRTGEVLPRKEIHRLGKPHRVIHLYLFDAGGRLLLQRRAETVDHYPGILTISVLGHVEAGESSMETARREIREELGLDPDGLSIRFLFSYRRDAAPRPDYIDRQFNDVYVARGDFNLADINFDRDEVAEVRLVDFQDFKSMIKSGGGTLTDLYGDEWRDLVYFLGRHP